MSRLNNSFANASIISGFLSWVPLFNLITTPLALIFGIIALWKIHRDPKKFGGMIRAIIGLTIAVVWIGMTAYSVSTEGIGIFLRQ